jgi:hypothetical protein
MRLRSFVYRYGLKGVRELDLTEEEAEALGGRAVARRGRRPGSTAKRPRR